MKFTLRKYARRYFISASQYSVQMIKEKIEDKIFNQSDENAIKNDMQSSY